MSDIEITAWGAVAFLVLAETVWVAVLVVLLSRTAETLRRLNVALRQLSAALAKQFAQPAVRAGGGLRLLDGGRREEP